MFSHNASHPYPLQLAHHRTLLPSQRSAAMMHSSAEAASGMLVYSRYSSDTQTVSYINETQSKEVTFETAIFVEQY
jgi:hypothetical protein